MTDLVIRNGIIATVNKRNEVLSPGSVAISGNRIEAVGPTSEVDKRCRAPKVLDATGKIVIPGLVNVHTHLFQTLMKGLGDDSALDAWFKKSIARIAPNLRPQDCRVASQLGCLEALKSGVTCLLDFMYAHPVPKLCDAILQVFGEVGIRGVMARGIVDNGKDAGMPDALIEGDEWAEDCERLLSGFKNHSESKIRVWVAPASIWMTSPSAFHKAYEIACKYKTGLTFHSTETRSVVEYSRSKYGKSDIQLFDAMLGPTVLPVHVVWPSEQELQLLASKKVPVAHCPIANMYLADGVSPIPRMRQLGINVGLGTDGAASNNNQDMIAVLKGAALIHKVHNLNPECIRAADVLRMATIEGARCLGLDQEIGSIEVGKHADVVVVNTQAHNMMPLNDPISNLIYTATQENVETVVIDGRIIVQNREVLTLNEKQVLRDTERTSQSLLAMAT